MRAYWRRRFLGVLLAGGCLWAGPCGITTLQWQDFLTSSVIRTGVTAFFSIVEAAALEGAAQDQNGGG